MEKDNQRPKKQFEKADCDKILSLIAQCQIAVNQLVPSNWPEKRIVGEKLHEATIWLKTGWDCAVNPVQGLMITPKKAEPVHE